MTKANRWIPYSFVAFFALIALLDGYFVYLAVRTNTGVITDHAYEKGLDYNQTLAAAENQARMGIKDTPDYRQGMLTWQLRDGQDRAVTKAQVHAKIIRPTQDGHDFLLSLAHQGNGVYAAPLTPPLPGAWDVKLVAQWEDQNDAGENKETWETRRYQKTLSIVTP
ncbi:MAG: FixH family protein [Alphaproteobacteria bacterium]|nr:FixH family protein [Alphaproteobacteria bacterium]